MSFAGVTAERIAFVENLLNTRSRKCFGYKPPDKDIEIFLSVEDIVVMSECFVARMSGKPF